MKVYRKLLKILRFSKANSISAIGERPLHERFPDKVVNLELKSSEFYTWVDRYYPSSIETFGSKEHKKLLELYVSWHILGIEPTDIYLDAAGGKYSYVSTVPCRQRLMQDIDFASDLIASANKDVVFIKCPSDKIDLQSESVDKISCHHSIEHFQGDADMGFIVEIQRILKHNGKCVIVPIFISKHAYLISDKNDFEFWREEGTVLRDPIASLPGGSRSGNFSRIYSLDTFEKRIINTIDLSRFDYRINLVNMDGQAVPNQSLFFEKRHAKINLSYRALLIWRK